MNTEENTTSSSQDSSTQSSTHTDPVMDFTKNNNNTLMGILSYLGPLVFIPYLMHKDNDFINFHAKQGMVLLGLEILVRVLEYVLSSMWMLIDLVNLAIFVLFIIGIVNVIQNKKKELPVIGSLAKNVNF